MSRPLTSVNTTLAVAVLASVAMLIMPLPPPLLDLLLAFDIMFATAVLVVALSIQNPLELAAFPSLLLVTTLFRLSLDVSATRLILTQGDLPGGVGSVIPAFGAFVMRGNPIVGLLLFIILVVVQLVVVTNGAQRVAEVAARFTLDAMPGKQMAIDADLHTGLIDADQARARRKAVQAEADFYGAMDGAGKFVARRRHRGDHHRRRQSRRRRGHRRDRQAPHARNRAPSVRVALDRERSGDDAARVLALDGHGDHGDARRFGCDLGRRPRPPAPLAACRAADGRRFHERARVCAWLAAPRIRRARRAVARGRHALAARETSRGGRAQRGGGRTPARRSAQTGAGDHAVRHRRV